MNVLFISDIMGESGRKAVMHHLPDLQEKYEPELIIANGENAAGGFGITPNIAEELLGMGIHVLTSGSHIWDKKEIYGYIDKNNRLLRPANFPPGAPGPGSALVKAENGVKVGVINLMGRVYLFNIDCPFRVAKEEVKKLREAGAQLIIIDMHAEATSEKIALARYLDGTVTAVLGTHTHVQTADERVLAGGTAFMTDVGMTGPQDSVIGVTAELAIERFLKQMPMRFDTAKGPGTLQAVVVTADEKTGRATKIERISLI